MAMGNIIKFLRFAISNLSHDKTEAESKQLLISKLKLFLEERILFARENIVTLCQSIISEDDVILTFGSSPVIRQILLSTANIKRFHLIIVDSMPLRDGIRTLSGMSNLVQCTYVPLSGTASVMKDVTRVILGMLYIYIYIY
jgi:translation initiation factor eIF-2B subunit delta